MKIEGVNGRLRFRGQLKGKRYCFSLELQDTKTNRLEAEKIKLQIEADIEQGCFDQTLAKYKGKRAEAVKLTPWVEDPVPLLTVEKLFDAWLAHKHVAYGLDAETLKWYGTVRRKLLEFFKDRPAALSKAEAFEFLGWLRSQKLHPETMRRRIEALTACWLWGVETGLVQQNPWTNLHKLIKVPQQPPPKPFTHEEVRAIVQGFEKLYPDFAQLIKFLFATGCRIGEALGLRWEDLSPDLSVWTLAEQLTRGGRKPTKTGKVRRVQLPNSIRQMLGELQGNKDAATGLVFTLNGGIPITDGNLFRRWTKVLAYAGVLHRKPYSTRSTFISHCLERGMNPLAIAAITGHDPAVLWKHYAGILHEPTTPELF